MARTDTSSFLQMPLEEVCMQILSSGFAKNCVEFLNRAPQPPLIDSVQAALRVLHDVGAVESHADVDFLTPLGHHLSKLPVDTKLGKMLLIGSLMRCIDPILTITASLSASKSPFAAFTYDAAVAKAKQRVFQDPDSDYITFCNVWAAYSAAAEKSSTEGRRFCQENYLNYIALREIGDSRRQFLELLCNIGFIDRGAVTGKGRIDLEKFRQSRFNSNARNGIVIHAAVAAGLYPNVLRLDQDLSLNHSMWHKNERVHFHKVSVNAAKKRFSTSERWVIFYEKFGTSSNRVSVSTTGFCHPYALLLFGGSVEVKHTERRVVVDDWMDIGLSAQTGVILREIRRKFDRLLQSMIANAASSYEIEMQGTGMVAGVIDLLNN